MWKLKIKTSSTLLIFLIIVFFFNIYEKISWYGDMKYMFHAFIFQFFIQHLMNKAQI